MENARKYYEAYDDRYTQVHGENLRWFTSQPSPIVEEVIDLFSISPDGKSLEIGCGEGRDAAYLLNRGFPVLATDISPAAIHYCRENYPQFAAHFRVLDCISGALGEKFDFIYAVAVIHMLVLNEDRAAFYSFIREHLAPSGVALICTMGDGVMERQSDINTAFELQERTHEETGRTVFIAGTSCRVVNFDTFTKEIKDNGLALIRQGVTAIEPDFPQMMYAVVRRA